MYTKDYIIIDKYNIQVYNIYINVFVMKKVR